jgi:glycosyltransferase involved in cell wall biosynthesis
VILIFSGRLEPPKGIDQVLHATRILSVGIPNVRLLIVGDGSAREELARAASQLGISERVTFTGRIARERIPLYLSAADVFVTGTSRESISMALLEALACGVPAVCGPVGGAREVLSGEMTGVVIEEVTPEALAEGTRAVLGFGGAARVACVAAARRYSASSSNQQILDALESVRTAVRDRPGTTQ